VVALIHVSIVMVETTKRHLKEVFEEEVEEVLMILLRDDTITI